MQKQKEQDGLVVPDGGGGGSGEASEDMPPPPPPLSQAGGEDAMEVVRTPFLSLSPATCTNLECQFRTATTRKTHPTQQPKTHTHHRRDTE